MKYTKISFSFDKYSTLDIISASEGTDPTKPTEVTQDTDPYKADKW